MSGTISGFLLLLSWYTLISSEVKWVRKTKPVTFGENVTLFCYLPDNFNLSVPRQWKTEGTSLTLDEGTTNGNMKKYEGSLEQAGFTLKIKQFAVEDFGRYYTCSYGFADYRANLTTENYQWISRPDRHALISTFEMIKFTLQFKKVYPEPNCTSLIGLKAIPAKFIITSHAVDGYFLATNLTLEYHYNTTDCGRNVSIVCKIGDRSVTENITMNRHCAGVCQRFSLCLNNGTCDSNKSSIVCDCRDGFNGERCENSDGTTKQVLSTTVVPESETSTTTVIGIGIGGIITLFVIAIVVYIIIHRRKKSSSDHRRKKSSSEKSQQKNRIPLMNGTV